MAGRSIDMESCSVIQTATKILHRVPETEVRFLPSRFRRVAQLVERFMKTQIMSVISTATFQGEECVGSSSLPSPSMAMWRNWQTPRATKNPVMQSDYDGRFILSRMQVRVLPSPFSDARSKHFG